MSDGQVDLLGALEDSLARARDDIRRRAEAAHAFGAQPGRRVIFRHHHGEEHVGVVSSANDHNVFVRFGMGGTAEACDPAQLRWEVAP